MQLKLKYQLKSLKIHIKFASLCIIFFVLSFGDCHSQSQFQLVIGDISNTEEAFSII